MNIKENITTVLIAGGLFLLILWGIRGVQSFFWPSNTAVTKTFNAPVAQEVEPLHIEIDFLDTDRVIQPHQTKLETPWGHLLFSTDGASLEGIDFKHTVDGKQELLSTLQVLSDQDREQRCFLVALDQKTPYYYDIVSQEDNHDSYQIYYQAKTHDVVIDKKFTVSKHKHQIDLDITIAPQNKPVRARLFYPGPVLRAIQKDDIRSAVIDVDGQFEKILSEKLDIQRGWYTPTIFGADDRYFVHALVADHNHFANRAYYKLTNHTDLMAIIETSLITTPTTWHCSFYFGPKNVDALRAVNKVLENTLDYSGILAPISYGMLVVLKWLYNYVGNFGFAIILLTALIRLILFPFTFRSEQGRKKQLEFQKKHAYLQQRYKHDPELLARERAELIRKHGLPGVGGCLPLLIQMPIFFALSKVLGSSIELYKAPMLWIHDLSAKDPYYILPLLVGFSLLLQALFVDDQQRISFIVMALVFGAVTANFSAGLALYFVVSTLLGVLQTAVMKRMQCV